MNHLSCRKSSVIRPCARLLPLLVYLTSVVAIRALHQLLSSSFISLFPGKPSVAIKLVAIVEILFLGRTGMRVELGVGTGVEMRTVTGDGNF